MISAINHRWIRAGFFPCAIAAQFLALRLDWVVNTESHRDLQTVKVRSGYAILLESTGQQGAETLFSYSGSAEHNHRMTLEINNAKLSDESQRYIAVLNPPHDASRVTYAPERSDGPASGMPCRATFSVEFPPATTPKLRSVRLYPPSPAEYKNVDGMRLIHLQSASAMTIRVSTNSEDGQQGPGCRELLTIGKWENLIGKDVGLAFNTLPDALVTLTLSPDPKGMGRFHSGKEELESLMMQPVMPFRVSIGPLGLASTDQILERVGQPFLTVTNPRLGGDYLDLDVSGVVGLPLSQILGAWKWVLFAAMNIPLLLWIRKAFSPRPRRSPSTMLDTSDDFVEKKPSGRMRIFMSYSWEDRKRVMEIYDLIEGAGAEPWIDLEKIPGGAEWESSIKEQMRESQRVLIFLSDNSVHKAGFAWAEMRMAVRMAEEQPEGTEFIIPVKLDDCRLPDLLSRWNAVKLFQPDGAEKLLDALELARSRQSVAVHA